MILSIIIPVFNEQNNIEKLINKLIDLDLSKVNFEKEIIVVNDGSTDNTYEILENYSNIIKIHQKNFGKGKAVQNGIKVANGDFVIIQDGDLEYDPLDILKMCKKLKANKKKVVYGSRYIPLKFNFIPKTHIDQNPFSYIANIVFVFMFLFIYQRLITDPLTGYKLYPKIFFDSHNICSNGFEADHEISAKLIKEGYEIDEVPISYKPRTVAEGKKINFTDAIKAIITIIRYRF